MKADTKTVSEAIHTIVHAQVESVEAEKALCCSVDLVMAPSRKGLSEVFSKCEVGQGLADRARAACMCALQDRGHMIDLQSMQASVAEAKKLLEVKPLQGCMMAGIVRGVKAWATPFATVSELEAQASESFKKRAPILSQIRHDIREGCSALAVLQVKQFWDTFSSAFLAASRCLFGKDSDQTVEAALELFRCPLLAASLTTSAKTGFNKTLSAEDLKALDSRMQRILDLKEKAMVFFESALVANEGKFMQFVPESKALFFVVVSELDLAAARSFPMPADDLVPRKVLQDFLQRFADAGSEYLGFVCKGSLNSLISNLVNAAKKTGAAKSCGIAWGKVTTPATESLSGLEENIQQAVSYKVAEVEMGVRRLEADERSYMRLGHFKQVLFLPAIARYSNLRTQFFQANKNYDNLGDEVTDLQSAVEAVYL